MTTTRDTADGARQQVEGRYPRHVRLSDGHDIELRLMGDGDVDVVLAFAQSLSPEDLMYLRVNITERPVVDAWVASIRAHRTLTALAVDDGQVLGEASLFYNTTSWTRHLGEIRIQMAPIARRRGIARILADEIDAIASELGLQLLTARMTLDQTAAQAVFRRLGFQREAVLWDYVITPDGKTRNVLVATKRL